MFNPLEIENGIERSAAACEEKKYWRLKMDPRPGK